MSVTPFDLCCWCDCSWKVWRIC